MLFMYLSKDGKTPKAKKAAKPKKDKETAALCKTMAKAEDAFVKAQKAKK